MSHEYKHTINVSSDIEVVVDGERKAGMPPGWHVEYIEHRVYDSPDREILAIHHRYGRVRIGVGSRIRDEDYHQLCLEAWTRHPQIRTIFLDVDDVIVDWVGGAIKLLGYDLEKIKLKWKSLEPRPWDFFDVIDHTKEDGWAEINNAGPEFWSGLDLLPWANDLIDTCRSFATTIFLTSPSEHHSSHSGKAQWMQAMFGRQFRDYLLGSVKCECSHPGALLIDDSPRNCRSFADPERGGHAILFPALANNLYHIESEDRLSYVKEQLKNYRKSKV